MTCKILPPAPSHKVQERPSELHEIKQAFVELRDRHEQGVIVVSITGYPGYGKSQLARQFGKLYYCDAILKQGRVIVATLTAENLDTMDKSLMNLAIELQCEGVVNLLETVEDPKRRMQLLIPAITGILRMFPYWLLLIDNLCNATKNTLDEYWPQPGSLDWGDGAVLVTSQEQGIIGRSSYVCEIQARGMTKNDAVDLLTDLSGVVDPVGAAEVARRLEYIPLPLSSAAVYVKFMNDEEGAMGEKTDWNRYLKELDIGLQNDCEHFLTGQNKNYPKTMQVAVRMAADRMAYSRVEFRQVFMLIGYCANQLLPLDCIEHYIRESTEIKRQHVAVIHIKHCSLLILSNIDIGKQVTMVGVHQVTHAVFRASITSWLQVDWPVAASPMNRQEREEEIMELTLETLNVSYQEADDSENVQERYMLRRTYLPHFLETTSHAEQILHSHSECVAKAMENSADVFDLLGDHAERFDYLKRAKIIYNGLYDDDDGRLSEFWLNFGCALLDLENTEGIDHIEKCLSIRQRNRSAPRSIARALFSLGLAYVEASQYELGIDKLTEALKIQQQTSSVSLLKGSILTALGRSYLDKGQLEEAKSFLHEAVDVMEAVVGNKHPSYAKAVIHLSRYYLEEPTVDPPKAVGLLESAMEIRTQHLGDEHGLVVTGMITLGRAYLRNGQLEKSKRTFEQVLHIQRSKHVLHGSAHCRALVLLSKVLLKEHSADNLQRAIQLLEEARQIGVSVLGEEHYEMGYIYHVLGVAYYFDGRCDDGMMFLESAKQLIAKFFGKGHYETIDIQTTIEQLASSYRVDCNRSVDAFIKI